MNNIKQLALILVLLCAPAMWAANYACTTSGGTTTDWNTASTWTSCNSTYPQAPGANTYQATITTGKTITCSGTCGVGQSAAVAGTIDLVVNQGGTLAVAAGSTLSVYGELDQQHGSTVTVASTCGNIGTLQQVVPTGGTYAYKITGGSGAEYLNLTGAAPSGARCDAIVNCSITGTGYCYFPAESGCPGLTTNWSYAQFNNYGNSSTIAYNNASCNPSGARYFHNVAFVNDGTIYLTTNDSTTNWDWDKVSFTNPQQATVAYLNTGGVAPTTSTRKFTNITAYSGSGVNYKLAFYVQSSVVGQAIEAGDASDVPGFQFYNVYVDDSSGYSVNQSIRNSIVVLDHPTSGSSADCFVPRMNANQTFYRVACYGVIANFHEIGGGAADAAISADIFQHFLADGDGVAQNDFGDLFIGSGTLNYYGTLNLNNAGTNVTSSSTSVMTMLNTTQYWSQGMAICESSCSPTSVVGYRNNVMVYPAYTIGEQTTATGLGVDGLHFNGIYNTVANELSWGASTMRSNTYFAMPGSGDVINGHTAIATGTVNGGSASYMGYFFMPKTAITALASKTTTAGSDATHIVCTGCDFVTNAVQTGMFVQDISQGAPYTVGVVASRTDATHLVLNAPGIASLTTIGHTFSIFPSAYSNTSWYLGDSNNLQQDQHVNPNWRDPDHATVCWWAYKNGATVRCNIPPATASGSFLATSGTNTTTIVCSACDFTATGLNVQVGEPLIDWTNHSTTNRGYSVVATVGSPDVHTLTVSPAITGMTSTDNFAFLDATQGVGRALATLNGWDYTGAYTAPLSWANVPSLYTYIFNAFTPMNGMLKNAAYSGDCTTIRTFVTDGVSCDPSAVAAYPSAILSN